MPADLLETVISLYDPAVPDTIPRLDDIRETLDYDKATDKHGQDFFDHSGALEESLPQWIRETQAKYHD